jgi:hypothetical protein
VDYIEATSPANNIAEVRVHGIGDHKEYSALGHPDFEVPQGRIAFGRPPILPEHTLILVNWARANRQTSKSIWWYIAFPFTLANVSGYMVAEHPGKRYHYSMIFVLFLVSLCGICLSISTAAWIVVILETAETRFYSMDSPLENFLLAISGSAILSAIIIYRWKQGQAGTNRCSNSASASHLFALLAIAVVAVRWPPATSYDYGFARLCAVTTGIVTVCGLLLSGISVTGQIRSRKNERPKVLSSLAGAALLLFCAILGVHTIGSVVRSAVDTVSGMVNRLRGVSQFIDRHHAVLLPYRGQNDSPIGVDFIPLFAVAIFVTFFFVLMIDQIATDARRDLRLIFEGHRGRLIWSGKAINNIPRWLGRVVFVTLLAASIEVSWLWWWLQTDLGHDQRLVSVVELGEVILGVTIAFAAVTRRPTTVFKAFEMIADLSGFWRVRYHPLAGTSYFPSLVEALIERLNGMSALTTALVGHSQGSVVCASLMSHSFDNVRKFGKVHLFTCGSPLQTLYRTFFPQYFNRAFFSGISEQTASWTNYWRETDPIASPINSEDGSECCVNIKLFEPKDRIWGHSNYWAETKIMDRTRLMITGQQKE